MAACETQHHYHVAQEDSTHLHDSALDQLQSEEQRELLDAIDNLRSANLSNQLNLPQLIVCGDQSSGKSSVLEAISEVRFPDNDVLCTRFASELILRKAEVFSFSVKIEPAGNRSLQDQEHLTSFQSSLDCKDVRDFPRVIIEAAGHMRKLGNDIEFFEDRLVANIRGPKMPSLTLVDLPGLIHASSKQGNREVATVKRIVESYMRQPKSIILAIVAANNNLANQEVLELIKKHDINLDRTLGIVTKPDLVPAGSQSEDEAIQCVLNNSGFIALQSGWHVLKNRDYQLLHVTLEERDLEESKFFASSKWRTVPEEDRGSKTLRRKLREMLLRAIRGSLPSLVKEIDSRVATCEELAKSLGLPKETASERIYQLSHISMKLHELVHRAMYGQYNSCPEFFDDGPEDNVSPRKLRTCLRRCLEGFAERMDANGKRFAYSDDMHPSTSDTIRFSMRRGEKAVHTDTLFIAAEKLEKSVEIHMERCKAFEPNGTVPPGAYTSILSFQCSRWETLATEYARRCWRITKEFFTQALYYRSPSYIAARVVKRFVDDHFEKTERQLMEKLQEMVKPYKEREFFTLNETKLIAQIQKSRRAQIDGGDKDSNLIHGQLYPMKDLTKAQEVLIWVFAAYEIALTTFLDNFATLVVEFCLVESLPELFTSADVGCMSAEELRQMTDEPQSVTKARSTNADQMRALKYALKVCTQHTDPFLTTNGAEMDQVQPVTQSDDLGAGIQRPTRTGTADDITAQLQNLSVSSTTSQANPSHEVPSTARKAKREMENRYAGNPTPPETPPRMSLSTDHMPRAADVRPRSAASSGRPKRTSRLIKPEYGCSPSPPISNYRTPSVAEPDDSSSE